MRKSGIAAFLSVAALLGVASCALVAGLGDERQLADATDTTPDGSSNAPPGTDAEARPDQDGAPLIGDADPPDGGYVGEGTIVIAGPPSPSGIAIDPNYIVWATQGDPQKPGSGALHVIVRATSQLVTPDPVKDQATPKQVFIDNSVVYWSNANDPPVTNGGAAVNVLTAGTFTLGMNVVTTLDDDTRVARTKRINLLSSADGGESDTYIFEALNDHVRRLSRTTKMTKDLVNAMSGAQPISAVAVDETYVYFFNANTVSRHLKVDPGNGNGPPSPAEVLAPLNALVVDMQVSNDTIWLIALGGSVYAMPTTTNKGTAPPVLATTGAGQRSVVVVGDTAYIARGNTSTTDGQILSVDKSGVVTVIAKGLPEPRELAVDTSVSPNVVYWTNGGDGTVRKKAVTP